MSRSDLSVSVCNGSSGHSFTFFWGAQVWFDTNCVGFRSGAFVRDVVSMFALYMFVRIWA